MSQEILHFEVVLSGTYWDKKPQFSVWLDDHVVVQSEIVESNIRQSIKFERKVDEGSHQLKIRLENKTSQDTVLVNSEMIKDMLLNIDDIIIDDQGNKINYEGVYDVVILDQNDSRKTYIIFIFSIEFVDTILFIRSYSFIRRYFI
jgi:hypothetical protein